MDMKEWIASLPGSPRPTPAAKAAGIDPSTISCQLKRGRLSAENVIILCRCFGKSPLDGLAETGYILHTDIEGVSIDEALEIATNKQIRDEVIRRIKVD